MDVCGVAGEVAMRPPHHRGHPSPHGGVCGLARMPHEPHTVLGRTSSGELAFLTLEERFRHAAVAGITGVGKSTLLKGIAAQDMARGDGLILLDPHGSLAEETLALIPPS